MAQSSSGAIPQAAMTGRPIDLYSQEEKQFLRISTLILKTGTRALRCFFDSKINPGMLQHELNIPNNKHKLNSLKSRNIIRAGQWDTLYPSRGGVASTNFDITLMSVLLQEIGGITAPTAGWGVMPCGSDHSEGADIVRLRMYRNEMAHNSDGVISNVEFQTKSNDIQQAILRLGGHNFGTEINRILTCSLDEADMDLWREVLQMKKDIAESNRKDISRGQLNSWKEDDEIFCPTKVTECIYMKAKSKQKILLDGLPGIGKSANAHHIALRLKDEGYRLFCVKRVKEMIEAIDKLGEHKQVFVFDDVFGVHGVVEEKRKEWSDENKDDLERCLKKPNVIILCTSRLSVIKDDKLSSINSRFTIIHMSQGEIELSDTERVEIFRKHAIAKQRDDLLKNRVMQKIKTLECPLGCFPLVCRLYTGDKETKQTIEEYFSKPLKVIAELLNNLRTEEPIRYFCLLLCLIYDNKLPVDTIEVAYESKQDETTKQLREEFLKLCELPVSTSLKTIKDRMDTLLQTFVKLEDNTYRFVHDIIHDAVIKHISNLSPDSDVSPSEHKAILRHCSSRFMACRVHLSGVECKSVYSGSGHDTESCINIRHDVFHIWARRVLELISHGLCTSDQVYNDISDGRCSKYDLAVSSDNPWIDIFKNNHCVRSTDGDTAIAQILAGKSSTDICKIMCKPGYTSSLFDYTHRDTALHWTLRYGLTNTALQIISMISQGQLQKLHTMNSLLCLACQGNCNTSVIQALIGSGLNVNAPDVDGFTPLCESVRSYTYEITKLLLDNGALVNQCDKYGKSALYYSQYLGHDAINELLKSRGAVCMYKGTQYNHITDIPDSQLDEWDRKKIQKLKKELSKLD